MIGLPAIEAMRPRQWLKNFLVFAPLLFARKVGSWEHTSLALLAFCSFCLAASAIYLWNDILDRERDRLHPEKSKRPIADGRLGIPTAVTMIVGLVVLTVVLGLRVRAGVTEYLPYPLFYLVLNLAYSLKLKHVVIVDALCISLGFLLRVVAGGVAIGVPCSSWLILCTFFVSLLLAFLKRRAELTSLAAGAGEHRQALRDYDPAFLDQLIGPLAALTVMAYALYTVDPHTRDNLGGSRDLLVTVPLVTYGIFRYLYLARRSDLAGDPTRTLSRDPAILINGLLWLAACFMILNGKGPGI